MILTDSIKINAPPEKVFSFFTGLRDGENYRAWHPDHVIFRFERFMDTEQILA